MQKDLNQLIGGIYQAALDDELWLDTLRELSEIAAAHVAQIIVYDRATVQPLLGISNGIPEGNVEYVETYSALDERWPRFPAIAHGEPIRHEQLYAPGEIERSAFYNEFLVKYDAQSQVIVRLDGTGGTDVAIGFNRPLKEGAFSEAEIGVVRVLAPHIGRAMQIRQKLVETETLNTSLFGLLESTRIGFVALDRNGKITRANDVAVDFLRYDRGLSDMGGRLRAAHQKENERLQMLIAGVLSEGFGVGKSGGAIRLTSPCAKRRLSVLVMPVSVRGASFVAGTPVAAVLIQDETDAGIMSGAVLRVLYGLSPAETRLALEFAKGQTLARCSEILGVSKETARTQLKSVLSKTGTHRQAELMRLLHTSLAQFGDLDD